MLGNAKASKTPKSIGQSIHPCRLNPPLWLEVRQARLLPRPTQGTFRKATSPQRFRARFQGFVKPLKQEESNDRREIDLSHQRGHEPSEQIQVGIRHLAQGDPRLHHPVEVWEPSQEHPQEEQEEIDFEEARQRLHDQWKGRVRRAHRGERCHRREHTHVLQLSRNVRCFFLRSFAVAVYFLRFGASVRVLSVLEGCRLLHDTHRFRRSHEVPLHAFHGLPHSSHGSLPSLVSLDRGRRPRDRAGRRHRPVREGCCAFRRLFPPVDPFKAPFIEDPIRGGKGETRWDVRSIRFQWIGDDGTWNRIPWVPSPRSYTPTRTSLGQEGSIQERSGLGPMQPRPQTCPDHRQPPTSYRTVPVGRTRGIDMLAATHAASLHRGTTASGPGRRKEPNRKRGRNVTAHVAHAAPLPAQEQVEDRLRALVSEVEGTNRGIFGVKVSKAEAIEEMAKEVEKRGSALPGRPVDRVDGRWRVLYSTIAIMGSKRTKLGLRGFLQLSDIYQDIDATEKIASNRITFRAPGLNGSVGALTLMASYKELSDTKVQVDLVDATLEPEQLRAIFEQNYDMLLEVFNPTGWLDITYVDEKFRIGRDDKGNLFILEKC
eukprot:scaffold1639_cov331-Pavlova_lutheri.AAC.22